MKLLDDYFKLQKQIYDYFGYEEDWVVIPIEDSTDYFWHITEHTVEFADTIKELIDEESGNYYTNGIYHQRFLPKWVYRTSDYTMICVDTHTDGNKFLQIFDNEKEIKDLEGES